MDALHARYPFTTAAREAVQAADVNLGDVVLRGGPAVDRAVERVERAIEDGTIGPPHRPRIELLSYPVARVLVSLVDDPRLIRRYAEAEAASAMERFLEDLDAPERRSSSRPRLSLDGLIEEFDHADDVAARHGTDPAASGRTAAGYEVAVTTYLALATDRSDDAWHLVNRIMADGRVRVTRDELFALLQGAIRRRVEDGLPVDVPPSIADALSDEVATIRERLADRTPTLDIDTVDPTCFPPCVTALLERVERGDQLAPYSRFALTAFLATIGMSMDDIVARYAPLDVDEEAVRSQVVTLREGDGPSVYPPPSCVTMQAYGDCDESIMDDLCYEIVHPLDYYGRRLATTADGGQRSSQEST